MPALSPYYNPNKIIELDDENIHHHLSKDGINLEIAPYGPGALTMGLMNWMVPAVISPTLGARGLNRWICQNGLYMRSHWLKMPPLLLVKHLTIKFFINFTKKEETYSP